MGIVEYEREHRTLGVLLRDKARRRGNTPFAFYRDQSITYEALEEQSNRIANALIQRLGVRKGDRIAVMFPNCAEYVVLQFAVSKTGGIQVPVNIEAKGELLAHFLKNSDPAAIVLHSHFLPLLQSIVDRLRHCPPLIVYGDTAGTPNSIQGAEIVSYAEVLAGSPDPPSVQVSWTDPVAIFYTSGTTGISKGVVLPHNHHYVFGMDIVRHGRITDQDRFYSYLPYYHGLAQFMATVPALLAEGSVVIAERFSASHFMEGIRKYGATLCWAVPAIASILMKQPSNPEDGDNPLRIFFTAGIDPEIEEAFEKRFGVRVLQAYGSTEQGPLTWVSYEKPKEAYGTAGRVNERFYEVKIVDEADRELAPGKTGEIVSRNKEPYTRMIEYWDMPRATLDAFRNLWLHSGELGFVDDAGWLHFVGRKKDAIRRRGEFISAFELESAMARHPGVMECAAFPIPSELGEDEIKVVIVARPGVRLEPAELVAFCEAHVARYMVPRYLELVDALPKTPTEKVEKVKLMERGLTAATWDHELARYVGS